VPPVNGLLFGLILVGGFVAGVVNTLAGGGSIITLPLLIYAGLPPTMANATNRVAIVLQNVGALAGFRRHGHSPGREAWILLAPSLAGGALGAFLAVDIDEALLKKIIGVVLVLMLIPILHRRSGDRGPAMASGIKAWMWIVYFLIGVYGGFLQVGVGFLYLGLLAGIQRMDLVRANLLKVFFVLAYSLFALLLFAWKLKVDWQAGFALALGTTGGGWVGAKLAVERGERWIRIVLVISVLVASLELTGLGRALFRLVVH
jgi:uncharacterized protein